MTNQINPTRATPATQEAHLEQAVGELGRMFWRMYFEAGAPYGFSTEGWRRWLETDAMRAAPPFIGIKVPAPPKAPRKQRYHE